LQDFKFIPGQTLSAVPSDRGFYAKLNEDYPRFIAECGLRPNPITDMEGGLVRINDGFELMKFGKVSATKLVYRIADI
jgi:hypothetical protein